MACQMSNRMCVYIPTHNRPDCIRYQLDTIAEPLQKYGIDIIISDSSSEPDACEVEKIISEYARRGCRVFNRRSPDVPEKLSERALQKYESYPQPCYKVCYDENELADLYDYIWLCGDGIVINVENIIPKVLEALKQQYDIIHITTRGQRGTVQHYDNGLDFYRDQIYTMTLYGASVISSKVAKYNYSEDNLEKYLGSGFLYVMSTYEYCFNHDFSALVIREEAWHSSPYKNTSGWIKNKSSLRIFGKCWVEANKILSVPDDEVRYEAIKKMSENCDHIFNWPYMMKHKQYGHFGLKELKQYKKYIPYISDNHIICFYITALTPKVIIKPIYYLVVHLRRR